jgi:uncharacterized protein (DUF433 family)
MDTILDRKTQPPAVIRTERGLTIAGTRITLYQIMDYLRAGWSREQIREMHSLTESQVADVLQYIEEHRAEIEAEDAIVLREAEEDRRYWEERNRERLAAIKAMPPPPGQEAIRAKLKAEKRRLGMDD